MSINEQVKELRIAGGTCIGMGKELIARFLLEAADTIEALSAKLQTAKMDRTAEGCGVWILCKDRLPTKEESIKNDNCFILDDGNRRYAGLFDYEKKCFVQFDFWNGLVEDKCAIAWQPLPAPYHEP